MYQFNSRKINSGDVYICLPKGEGYIQDAYKKGAVGVWKTTRKSMASLANNLFKNPSSELRVLGVTGTNGKTTVVHMVTQALNYFGENSVSLGTLNSPLTTPESLDIQRLLREHRDKGGTYFVMEVSSHAIAQNRVSDISFFCRALTNITQDHLDFHGTFESYKNCKHSFLTCTDSHTVLPDDYMTLNIPRATQFLGEFNTRNSQCAAAILQHCGYTLSQIEDAFNNISPPPGRFEPISMGQPFEVIVDYAHTPDGLENVCQEAKKIAEKSRAKLITIFGCGGDRDRAKRPLMAAVAETYSDQIIVTQDNPRTEDPSQIIDDILKGFHSNTVFYIVENDRASAIKIAISQAQPGDVVLIAGKGHEDYQIIGHKKIHFDDRKVAQKALSEHAVI
jgi:UDP-N-acetylmuramoyl-L-alanyl-D-glutamate--2,6-diaminopimelate ligase